MRFYLNSEIDNDTAIKFDEKTEEYKNLINDLQELIFNKKQLLNEHILEQIEREERFTIFLFEDMS